MKAGGVSMGGGLSRGEMGGKGVGRPEGGVLGQFKSARWMSRDAGEGTGSGVGGSEDVDACMGTCVGVGGGCGCRHRQGGCGCRH